MKGIASIDGQRWKELDEGGGVQHCYVVNIAKVNLTTSEDCEFGQQLQFNSQSLIKTNQVFPLVTSLFEYRKKILFYDIKK